MSLHQLPSSSCLRQPKMNSKNEFEGAAPFSRWPPRSPAIFCGALRPDRNGAHLLRRTGNPNASVRRLLRSAGSGLCQRSPTSLYTGYGADERSRASLHAGYIKVRMHHTMIGLTGANVFMTAAALLHFAQAVWPGSARHTPVCRNSLSTKLKRILCMGSGGVDWRMETHCLQLHKFRDCNLRSPAQTPTLDICWNNMHAVSGACRKNQRKTSSIFNQSWYVSIKCFNP